MAQINKNFLYYGIIMVSAMLVGVVAIKFIANPLIGDELQYEKVATDLLYNYSYPLVDDFLSPPGYPLFLTICYKIFGHNHSIIYFFQALLLGGIGIIIFQLGQRFLKLPHWQALIPSAVIIFWPYFIFYTTLILSEILFTFFLTFSAFLLIKYYNHISIKTGIFLGIAVALATLTRAVSLLLLVWLTFFLAILFIIKNKKIYNKKLILYILIPLATFSLTITPWTIYASLKMNNFTPVTAGIINLSKVDNLTYIHEWANYKTPGFEPEAKVIKSKLLLSKLKNFYRFWKSGASGTQAQNIINVYPLAKYFFALYKILFYLLLSFFFLSLLFFKKNRSVLLLWLIVFYFWALHTAMHPYPRYTLPIIPLMIIMAFYSLFNFKQILHRSKLQR